MLKMRALLSVSVVYCCLLLVVTAAGSLLLYTGISRVIISTV